MTATASQIEGDINSPHCQPICKEIPPVIYGFPSQRASNTESSPMSWRALHSLPCVSSHGHTLPVHTMNYIYSSHLVVDDDQRFCWVISLIARFMGPTWGPSGADRTQVGPMLAHELCYMGYLGLHQWNWQNHGFIEHSATNQMNPNKIASSKRKLGCAAMLSL